MKFDTVKLEQKLRKKKVLGWILFFIGVLFLIFNFNKGSFLTSIFETTVLPVIGIFTLFYNHKRSKEIQGEFIHFKDKGVHFLTRGKEVYIFKDVSDYSVQIALDEIHIQKNGNHYTIFLDDYPSYEVRKKIKSGFVSYT